MSKTTKKPAKKASRFATLSDEQLVGVKGGTGVVPTLEGILTLQS